MKTFSRLVINIALVLALTLAVLTVSTFTPRAAHGFGSPSIRISSGAHTGVYFPIASAVNHIILKSGRYRSQTTASSGSVENIRRILKNQAEMAIVQSDTLYAAYNGHPPFDNLNRGAKPQNLRAITSLYGEQVHIVARKKCVRRNEAMELSPAILKRCQFNLAPPGSGTTEHARIILKKMDIDPAAAGVAETYKFTYHPFPEAMEAMTSGAIDGGFFTIGRASLSVVSLLSTDDFYLLSLPIAALNAITADAPQISQSEIPPNTYPNQANVIKTIAVYALLATSTDRMSNGMVRDLLEMLFADIETLRSAHTCGRMFSLQTALEGISIPVHDGAKEFFVKQGLISPVLTRR